VLTRVIFAAALALIGGVAVAQPVGPANYADEANWLCRPGRQDACAIDLTSTVVEASGAMRTEAFTPTVDPAVDCFYVYPTVSLDPGSNSDLVANDEELRVIASQFARFGSVCRLFAPMYRQVTLTALRSALASGAAPSSNAPGMLAYADVAASFRHYLANDNNGRPFVLIGHSQGARMLQILVQREIDGQPLQERMLSAMLIGFNASVPVDADVGGDFRATPLCRSPSQLSCLVTYVSFRETSPPPANSRFGRSADATRQVACTNPAALAGGESAPLTSYLGARSAGNSARPAGPWVSGGAAVDTAFVQAPGLLSARCVADEHGSYLAVRVHGDPTDPRADDIVGDVATPTGVLADWGLHLIDVSIAQGDLINLVRSQAAAYAAR